MTHQQATLLAADSTLRDVPLNGNNLADLNAALVAATPALGVAILNLRNRAAACVRGGRLDLDRINLTAAIVAFEKAIGDASSAKPR